MSFCSQIRITIYADTEEELRARLEETPKESEPHFEPIPIGNRFMMCWFEEPNLDPPEYRRRSWGFHGIGR